MRKPGSAKAEAAVRLAATRIMERWFRRAADVGLHTSVEREELRGWCERYL
jgi:hypothetical protein